METITLTIPALDVGTEGSTGLEGLSVLKILKAAYGALDGSTEQLRVGSEELTMSFDVYLVSEAGSKPSEASNVVRRGHSTTNADPTDIAGWTTRPLFEVWVIDDLNSNTYQAATRQDAFDAFLLEFGLVQGALFINGVEQETSVCLV